ncbi:hypothetical protein M2189_002760 [Bradyrhizobium japonicum]|nr:hypothetical protein [Bradyrhizobium japonicum]MCS3959557.1 hypothetical protein [Bradyrhizobium japonicum]MCS4001311.1 hypothetical protein [Bradyrhizobium japonicum]
MTNGPNWFGCYHRTTKLLDQTRSTYGTSVLRFWR